jgi:hypothetical protein
MEVEHHRCRLEAEAIAALCATALSRWTSSESPWRASPVSSSRVNRGEALGDRAERERQFSPTVRRLRGAVLAADDEDDGGEYGGGAGGDGWCDLF